MATTIIWFRQDLRLHDQPALIHAIENSDHIIPLYIFDTTLPKPWQLGSAQRWWLHHSLAALAADLADHGQQLILRRGDPKKILTAIIADTQATTINWNRCYEPHSIAQDTELKKYFTQQNIAVNSFNGSLLVEPWKIKNQQGNYFKVFTPYWRHVLAQLAEQQPQPLPNFKNIKSKKVVSEKLQDWNLPPTHPDWSAGLKETWVPGERGATKKLKHFINKNLAHYLTQRDRPAINATSMLSPHLHFGEISPWQVWHAVQIYSATVKTNVRQGEMFLRQLGWREFSYYLLYHFPALPKQPFRAEFSQFPWHKNTNALKAWQQGKTGFPIVDAGMRQLWHTGWMHNRVRMIVASFLTKDLLLPWQIGEAWFWDTLVDADLANNAASWQWVAGSGVDAAPYFRIFNPVLQGEKFDPDGEYVKQWVPELKLLPTKYVHQPALAPAEILMAAKIILGKTYPHPIVDHKLARERALEIFKKLKHK